MGHRWDSADHKEPRLKKKRKEKILRGKVK